MGSAPRPATRRLDEGTLEEAIDAAQRAGDARLLRRLCFVRNLYEGDSATEAGRRVGVSSATASRWARRWETDGVDGLRPGSRDGRPAALDAGDRAALASALEQRPRWTIEDVRRLIDRGFDVSYSIRHVYRIVDELGCADRIRRSIPEEGRGDPIADDAVLAALASVNGADDPAAEP